MMTTQPKFNQLNIVSADLEASLKFYRHLGVEIPEAMVRRTPTGLHHGGAQATTDGVKHDLDIETIPFCSDMERWLDVGRLPRTTAAMRRVLGRTLRDRRSS